MTRLDILPTTPGSTVTFDLPADSDGEIIRAVVTLIAGHIDDDGVAHDLVWASADVADPDDASCVFQPVVILASNPDIAVLTEAVSTTPDSLVGVGTVIRVIEHDIPMTYTFAPCYLWRGEMQESFWTNSYGGSWRYDEDAEVQVLYAPQLPDRA